MQPKNGIMICGLVCVFLLSTPQLLSTQTLSEVSYTAEFFQIDLGFGTLDGYDVIHMRNASVMSELGKPVLPAKTIGIAIPAGTRAARVEAQSLSSIPIPGNFYLLP